MLRKWTEEGLEYLRANYGTQDTHELAAHFNTTYQAIKCKSNLLGLKKDNRKSIWYGDKLELLKKLYANSTNAEIGKLLGHSEESISAAAFKYGLKKSAEHVRTASAKGFFKKGQIPVNKGKKMPPELYEKVKHTFFKKGHVSDNYRPIGSERVSVDGYVEIKVQDPSIWKLKHRLVWEDNNGKIKQGFNVQFKDGNRENCEISNLYLITRKDQVIQNSIHRYPDALQKAIRLNHKLNRIIKEKENEQI